MVEMLPKVSWIHCDRTCGLRAVWMPIAINLREMVNQCMRTLTKLICKVVDSKKNDLNGEMFKSWIRFDEHSDEVYDD